MDEGELVASPEASEPPFPTQGISDSSADAVLSSFAVVLRGNTASTSVAPHRSDAIVSKRIQKPGADVREGLLAAAEASRDPDAVSSRGSGSALNYGTGGCLDDDEWPGDESPKRTGDSTG